MQDITSIANLAMKSLDGLIAPLDRASFLSNYWGKQYFVASQTHLLEERFVQCLQESSVSDLLRAADGPVMVLHNTMSGEYRATHVGRAEAFAFYESGLALYFDLSPHFHDVSVWTDLLARELGQKRSSIRISMFLSPSGSKTEWHFDPNENLTIQLRGHKVWRIARNLVVRNPIERFTVSGVTPSLLALYANQMLPSQPPLADEAVEMAPGSLLYLPRGYWHEVEALEESASLNICINPETWLRYLWPLLEQRLLAEEAWRDLATGVRGTAEEQLAARQKAVHLLHDLPAILSSLDGEDMVPILGAGGSPRATAPDRVFARNLLAVLHHRAGDVTGDGECIVQLDLANASLQFRVSPAQLRMCRWICTRQKFTRAELLSLEEWRDSPEDEITKFLQKLVRAGFIREGGDEPDSRSCVESRTDEKISA